MNRRRARTLAPVAALLAVSVAGPALAQGWPAKPVRWIMPNSAGSGADTVGRILANGVSQSTGQPIVVENRAGAAGNIAAEFVAKAPRDGYTVLQVNFSHSVNATLYPKLGYDLLRDFTAVTNIGASPALLVVHPSLPVRTVKQLVALARSRPGAINYASAGAGSPTFIGGELFRLVARVDMLHVPYRGGGEAINAMVAGESAVYFAPLASALPHVRSGRLRAIAAMDGRRIPVLPDVPTVGEAGFPGAESGFWHGTMVPAGTPAEVVSAFHAAVSDALRREETSRRLVEIGYSINGDGPAPFAQFIRSEVEKWRKVVQAAGLTAQ
jgi:tripartite-type tricarboxylate transporter receptor subunit TctC